MSSNKQNYTFGTATATYGCTTSKAACKKWTQIDCDGGQEEERQRKSCETNKNARRGKKNEIDTFGSREYTHTVTHAATAERNQNEIQSNSVATPSEIKLVWQVKKKNIFEGLMRLTILRERKKRQQQARTSSHAKYYYVADVLNWVCGRRRATRHRAHT